MRSFKRGSFSFLLVVAGTLLCLFLLSGTALAESWLPKDTGGFGDPANMEAISMAVFNSNLYVGTYTWGKNRFNAAATEPGPSEGQGCEVWRYDGANWTQVVGQDAPGTPGTGPGFGNSANLGASSMAVLGSYLYVGTDSMDGGCEVWRFDGTTWTQVVGGLPGALLGSGFGNAANIGVHSMATDGKYLYAGTNNYNIETGGCEVWRFDGNAWAQLVGGLPGALIGSGFGSPSNGCAHSMAFVGSALYVGTFNAVYMEGQGCEVWRFDGTTWTQVVGGLPTALIGSGFGDSYNTTAWSMTSFDGVLYVGTEYMSLNGGTGPDGLESDGSSEHGTKADPRSSAHGQSILQNGAPMGGCQVWRLDSNTWTQVVGDLPTALIGSGFGSEYNFTNTFLAVYNDFLYAGTLNPYVGCQVWRFDRKGWTQANQDGFGDPYNFEAACMAPYFGTAFVGTGNPYGSEVWAMPYTYYFAEGNTGADFQQYLCLGNPFPATSQVTITYLLPDNVIQLQNVSISPNYRTTIPVNEVVGAGKDVACKLESDLPLAAERPMYFNYNGVWDGGSDAVAADATSTTWYFAEGYTGPGFDELICVLNPYDQVANLSFRFQTQEEGLKVVTGFTVPPSSRRTFKVNDILGPNYQASLKLVSDIPVVAERPTYFDYRGTEDWHWTGGHCVMGTTSLAKQYYFAEGTTRPGFEEWLTLQNPNPTPITINATYLLGPGQGAPITKSYTFDSERRFTVYVPDEIGTGKDVSVSLSSSSPFLAERPMYFRYTSFGADWTGGHCVIGATSPAMAWFFGEGYTSTGFQEWLCLLNPGNDKAVVEIYYFTQEQGPLATRQVEVPAKTRVNVRVNDSAGPDLQLSTRVNVASGPAIVVERPMYFLYGGAWSGGHDVVGYAP
jgi:hypothetical protein